jgi:RND family efflux transporter MFP subunit
VTDAGFPHTAVVDFIDNRVDPETGTMRVRAVLRNESRVFSPGFFVRVKLPFGQPQPALLVTERAIGADQGRKYVLVVNDQDVVEYRGVQPGAASDGLRVVSGDLKPGEWVIVNGIQRARPGAKVAPQRVAMDPQPQPAAGAAGS